MSTDQKLNLILAQAIEEIKSVTSSENNQIEGGIIIMASLPTDDGKVSRHTVTIGKGAVIASTMTLAMMDEPKLEGLTSMVLDKLPLMKLFAKMPEGMRGGLLDSIEADKLC